MFIVVSMHFRVVEIERFSKRLVRFWMSMFVVESAAIVAGRGRGVFWVIFWIVVFGSWKALGGNWVVL